MFKLLCATASFEKATKNIKSTANEDIKLSKAAHSAAEIVILHKLTYFFTMRRYGGHSSDLLT